MRLYLQFWMTCAYWMQGGEARQSEIDDVTNDDLATWHKVLCGQKVMEVPETEPCCLLCPWRLLHLQLLQEAPKLPWGVEVSNIRPSWGCEGRAPGDSTLMYSGPDSRSLPHTHLPPVIPSAVRWFCRCSHSDPESVYLKIERLSAWPRPKPMSPSETSFLQLAPEVWETRSSRPGNSQAFILWTANGGCAARKCTHPLGAERNLHSITRRKTATQPSDLKEVNSANNQWAWTRSPKLR